MINLFKVFNVTFVKIFCTLRDGFSSTFKIRYLLIHLTPNLTTSNSFSYMNIIHLLYFQSTIIQTNDQKYDAEFIYCNSLCHDYLTYFGRNWADLKVHVHFQIDLIPDHIKRFLLYSLTLTHALFDRIRDCLLFKTFAFFRSFLSSAWENKNLIS